MAFRFGIRSRATDKSRETGYSENTRSIGDYSIKKVKLHYSEMLNGNYQYILTETQAGDFH